MIKDKQSIQTTIVQDSTTTGLPDDYLDNPMAAAYLAVKDILSAEKLYPDDPDSPPLFYSIKMDNGQLSRIINRIRNNEYEFRFPAVLIHFINVYYTVGQSNTYEGKGTMRIHYILNRLNNSDETVETEGFYMFQRINTALQGNYTKYAALTRRFQLSYWDQPLAFNNGIQPYWIDYDIWFRDTSTDRQKNYIERYLVIPPFTNHSDQTPGHNPEGHSDHPTPTYDEASQLVIPD